MLRQEGRHLPYIFTLYRHFPSLSVSLLSRDLTSLFHCPHTTVHITSTSSSTLCCVLFAGADAAYHINITLIIAHSCPKIQSCCYTTAEIPTRPEGFSLSRLFSQAKQNSARLYSVFLLHLQALEVVSIQKPAAAKDKPRGTHVKIGWIQGWVMQEAPSL